MKTLFITKQLLFSISVKSNLRTADVFPVVASLPREKGTGADLGVVRVVRSAGETRNLSRKNRMLSQAR